MSSISRVAVVVCLFFASIILVSAQTTTFTVNTTTDSVDANPGDGICADAEGRCSLRAAIMEANANADYTEIILGAGDYITTLASGPTDESFGDLDITQSTRISGAGADATFISNGVTGERVMELSQGVNVGWGRVENLTLRNGDTLSEGGGLYIASEAIVYLLNIEVTDNRASNGGGIWVESMTKSLVLADSSIISNTASDSCGGLYIGSTDNDVLQNITFYGNTAVAGNGGAVCFSQYAAQSDYHSPVLNYVTITQNSAGTSGGGIISYYADQIFLGNSIVVENNAGTSGANCAHGTPAQPVIFNDFGNIFDVQGCSGSGETDLVTDAPILGTLARHAPGHTRVVELVYGSPALDYLSKPHYCNYDTKHDQRGVTRPQGPSCDAGAYEMEQGPAQTYTVNSEADTIDVALGDAICADASGNCSLRAALMQANAFGNADTIVIPAGHYVSSLTTGPTDDSYGDFDILHPVSIQGANADETIISSGIASHRVLEIRINRNVDISSPSLNFLDYSVFVERVSITGGNTSENGGGIFIDTKNLWVYVFNVEVAQNTATNGGGVWVDRALVFWMELSTIAENTASDSCGGVYFGRVPGRVNFGINTVAHNKAITSAGGGVCLSEFVGTAPFTNIPAYFLELSVVNNSAGTTGGGVINLGTANVSLGNSILAENTAGSTDANCAFTGTATETFVSAGYNLYDLNGCTSIHPDDIITDEPGLGSLALHSPGHTRTVSLVPGSPAIDAANPADCIYQDQRGVTRPQGLTCDIGAFELEQGPTQTYTVNSTADTIDVALGDAICADSSGNCSLRAALMEANAFANADTIIVPAGQYTSSLTSGPTDDSYGDFDVLQAVIIQGANADETIISSGIAGERVLEITVNRHLNSDQWDSTGSVHIERASFTDGNTLANGGGILIDSNVMIFMVDTEVANNVAANGGGIWIERAHTFWTERSTIAENTATNSCGGLYAGRLSWVLNAVNATIAENTAIAGEGGGMCFSEFLPDQPDEWMITGVLSGLSIVNNHAGTIGGGVVHRSTAKMHLAVSLLVGNTAGVSGHNCAFAGDATETFYEYGHNLFDTNSCTRVHEDDIVTGTPNLGPLALHAPGHTRTVSLLPNSPAVDAGDLVYSGGDDQRGVRRPSGYGLDIGAYELIQPGVWVQVPEMPPIDEMFPLKVSEGGATAQFQLHIGSEPQGTAVYTFSDTGGDLSFEPAQIEFTAENWDDWEAGTVTVSAVDDIYVEGLENTEVIVTVSGTAPEYAGVVPRTPITVEITDNDSPQISVAPSVTPPLVVSEDGTTASFDISINSEPTGTVTVTLGGAGSDFVLDVPSVEFNAANWQTPVTVTVSAPDDGIAEGTKNGAITFTIGGTAVEYAGMTLSNLAVTVLDDDSTALNIMPSTLPLSISEDGLTGSIDISLDSEPTGTVTITFGGAGGDFALSVPSVEFDAINWDTPVTVTVSAIDDTEAEGTENTAITFTIGGTAAEYAGMTHAKLPVRITDDDLTMITEDLITNGGWEIGGVTAWKYTSAQAKRQCKGTGNGSHCALLLKPGLPAAVAYQDVQAALVPFEAGETLYFEFAARVGGTAKLNAILKLKYLDGTRGKLKVRPMPVNTAKSWVVFRLEESSVALLNLKAIRVQFKHNGGTGKIRVDDVLLQRLGYVMLPRGEVSPLPALPDGFRGGN